jgi:hypothetical protein
LGAPSLVLASGCYFSPAPLPADPSPERPNLNLSGAVPSPLTVLNVYHNITSPVSFTVPFTAVDGGQEMWWFLWQNWGLEGAGYVDHGKVAQPAIPDSGMGGAGPIERSVQFFWAPSGTINPGCNQLTLFVTYADNANLEAALRPFDLAESAMVTYWVNVDAPLGEGQTLVDCPLPAPAPAP